MIEGVKIILFGEFWVWRAGQPERYPEDAGRLR